MNRKETAEQLRHVIKNQANLIPEDYFALNEAINELSKCCANCAHQYKNGSEGDYCGYLKYRIIDSGEAFCSNHQTDIFASESNRTMKYKTLALNTQRTILTVQGIEGNGLKDRIVEMIIEREKKGYEKYKQTMDRRDYTKKDWLMHLLEEILDAAQYAMAAGETDMAEQFMYDAMNTLSKIDKIQLV